jgi:hypothetical protein
MNERERMKRDKFLIEEIGSERWNDYDRTEHGNTFSSWRGFGQLWGWAQRQGWWNHFVLHGIKYPNTRAIPQEIIHPDRFADAVYSFLKETPDDI